LTHGLQFQSSYTLSRAQDEGGSQSSATFTPGFSALFDPLDAQVKMVCHLSIAVTSSSPALFTTPTSRSERHGQAILNDWTIAPIVNMFSGFRYTAVTNNFSPPAVLLLPIPSALVRRAHQRFEWIAAVWLDAEQRVPCAVDQVRRLALSRRFKITEGSKLEFLAEGFNIFNRTQVTGVNNRMYVLSAPTTGANANTVIGYFRIQRLVQRVIFRMVSSSANVRFS
jgi:hypothetical protein